jgi:hypothetical protein
MDVTLTLDTTEFDRQIQDAHASLDDLRIHAELLGGHGIPLPIVAVASAAATAMTMRPNGRPLSRRRFLIFLSSPEKD